MCTCVVLFIVCLMKIGTDCISVETMTFPFDDALLDTNYGLYACAQQNDCSSSLVQQNVQASHCCTFCPVRQRNASTSCNACADAGV